MNEENTQRLYKVRSQPLDNDSQGNVVGVSHPSSKLNLVRVPPVVLHTQAGVAMIPESLVNNEATVLSTQATATQPRNQIQSDITHTHTQPQSTNVQAHTIGQSQGQTSAHAHSQPHLNLQTTLPLTQSLIQIPNPTLTHSLVYTQPPVQGPSELHTQPHMHPQNQTHIQPLFQVHRQTQVHTLSQVNTQTHVHLVPLAVSQHEVAANPAHIQAQSQQTQNQSQSQVQLSVPNQSSITHNSVDLASTQMEIPSHQVTKTGENPTGAELSITRPSLNADIHNLVGSSGTQNEVHSNSQAQILSGLTSLPLADQLTTSVAGVQQGNTTLTQTMTQSITQAQLLEALAASKLLASSKISPMQATPTSSTVGSIDGISLLRVHGSYATRPEDGSVSMASSAKDSCSINHPTSQTIIPQITSAQMEVAQLGSVEGGTHIINPEIVTTSVSKKQNSGPSNLIASNRMLNRLLDTGKPHIPSQVTKAAEIAHLVPNPTVRMSCSSRTGVEDSTGVTLATSQLSGPLTTSARNSEMVICTVNSTSRSSSGYKDTSSKAPIALQVEGMPANVQLNSNTVIVPSSVSHGSAMQQKHLEAVQQVLLGSHTSLNMLEQHHEGVTLDQIRVMPTKVHATQVGMGTSSNVITNNCGISLLTGEKNSRKMTTNYVNSNRRAVNAANAPEISNKGNVLLDTLIQPQATPCTKTGMITVADPIFPSVMSSGSSSPTNLGTFCSSRNSGSSPVEGSTRVRSSVTDPRVSHLALLDLLNRGPSSDTFLSGGVGLPLTGQSDNHLPHTGDVLLSELHRSDESDLSLNASLSDTGGEELHSNPSTIVSESTLGTGLGVDSSQLQGLPSPPLSSFNLASIASDFMVGVSGSKTNVSGQIQLPTLLSNLVAPSDLDPFLENTNMCIDMSSMSESEVSLSTVPGTFSYSPDKSCNSKKSSNASCDLTFTSALKAVTTKLESEQAKPGSGFESPGKLLQQQDTSVMDSTKQVCNNSKNSSQIVSHSSEAAQEISAVVPHALPGSPKKRDSQGPTNPVPDRNQKRKQVLHKNELLVQQVACFKCRLCSYLSQDKGEMVNHMKELHSKYLSESEESEEEESERPPPKRLKVFLPQNNNTGQLAMSSQQTNHTVRSKKDSLPQRTTPQYKEQIIRQESGMIEKRIVKVEDPISSFIKDEPGDVAIVGGEGKNGVSKSAEEMKLIVEVGICGRQENDRNCAEEDAEDMKLTIVEAGLNGRPESDRDCTDDTNDSSATNDSGSVKPNIGYINKRGRPMFSKTTGITKLKRSKPKNELSEKELGIRCDVNGCGLRMKSEMNIEYHRKCHVKSFLHCQECPMKFGTWRKLAIHLWRQHMIDMELHKCDKCDYKAYSYSKLMNVHYKVHSDERPSLCDTCGKRFKTVKQLRNHKVLHLMKTESPQYLCETCQRPFSDKRMLRSHQDSVHKKVKPFLCNYCGYSTASKSTLKMHMRQHTGEKPFACDKCDYRTADHNSLRRHKMQHTGVRPYRCPYCSYASIQSTTFKVHLKDNHPALAQMDGIMFTCGLCKFKTVKRDNYLAHVAEHSKGANKKQKQDNETVIVSNKQDSPEVIVGDLTPRVGDLAPSAPHVVNIDVNSGAVTVESPHGTGFIHPVYVQRVRSSDGLVHLGQEVIAVPVAVSIESPDSSSIPGVVYVASTSQGGQ